MKNKSNFKILCVYKNNFCIFYSNKLKSKAAFSHI